MRQVVFIGIIMALLQTGCERTSVAAPKIPMEDWQQFQEKFISRDGRVIDTVNDRVSHSEGQGYGMLLAHAAGDKETFQKLWDWTRQNLQIRQNDKLFAWKWEPSPGGGGEVTDTNNASDGDVLIAWALYRAGVSWERKDYYDAAKEISAEVREKLLRRSGRATYLLPGSVGFVHDDSIVVNLSYWVFPAFQDLHRLDGSEDWLNLNATGLALLHHARYGEWNLPPDWLKIGQNDMAPAEDFEPLYSYNAIRIPLHLVWAEMERDELLKPYADYSTRLGLGDDAQIPASINLNTGKYSEDKALTGMQAILKLTRAVRQNRSGIVLPALDPEEEYYSAALLLLTKLAQAERSER
jgi:endoglucanase